MGISDLTWRGYGGREDLPGLTVVRNTRQLRDGDGEFVTEATMAETYDHLQRCDPATDILVVEGSDGGIVGYGRTEWHDISEGYRGYWVIAEALPELDGLDLEIFERIERRATDVAAAHVHDDKRLVSGAGEGSSRQAALVARGYSPVSYEAVMVRPHLDDIADDQLPAGVTSRPVIESDWRALWEAETEAFRDGNMFVESTEEDFEAFCDAARSGTELWQVAFAPDGSVIGQVRTHVNPGEAEALGRRRVWTENISTRRDWRGKGIASALICASLRQIAALGHEEAALEVDVQNPTKALRVYERLGYQVVLREYLYGRSV